MLGWRFLVLFFNYARHTEYFAVVNISSDTDGVKEPLTQVPSTEAMLLLAGYLFIRFRTSRNRQWELVGTCWVRDCPNQEQSAEVSRWLLRNRAVQGPRWKRVNRVGRRMGVSTPARRWRWGWPTETETEADRSETDRRIGRKIF